MSETTDFQKQMRQVTQSHLEKAKRELEEATHRNNAKLKTIDTVKEVLRLFASETIQCDTNLSQYQAPEGSIGITIFYNRTHSTRPSFNVSVTCQPDYVEVNVSDGRWSQVPGVLGLWADWTDQHKVYSGMPDSSEIRSSMEAAFLTWYEAIIKLP